MSKALNILVLSSEVAPFAKTGGLADVVGALPKALRKLGHDVRIMLPKYIMEQERQFNLREVVRLRDIEIPMGDEVYTVSFKSAFLTDSRVQVYFLEYDPFYARESLYLDPATRKDWKDNPERFGLFCRAVLSSLKILHWSPDMIHCNDWQTALVPFLLKSELADDPFYKHTRTLLSIHNLGYQGNYDPDVMEKIGVPRDWFQPMGPFEFFGKFSFLKTGLVYSDLLNTVSENYAKEIQSSAEFGAGMEGILKSRSEDLFGILNGIDVDVWNPATDELIPANYSKEDLSGKAVCKEALCKKGKLPYSSDIPLIGIISRLATQKGFDLLEKIINNVFALDMQLVLLGTGEKQYHKLFTKIAKKYSKKASIHLTFDNTLAHWIEAGADMFLMPSRYEPCGLNQMMSMRYGTVPVVRATGGLADTVVDVDHNKQGNGFVFTNYDSKELLEVITRAVAKFADKEAWRRIQLTGMEQDFSWTASAKKYVKLYEKALSRNQ
jgi:starch synthase